MGELRLPQVFINLLMADLVTISDYKYAEGITGPKEDLRISRIIPSVSELVKTYCGNSFVDFYGSDKTEDFDIYWDTYAVQLTESPIVSITSVKEGVDMINRIVHLLQERMNIILIRVPIVLCELTSLVLVLIGSTVLVR